MPETTREKILDAAGRLFAESDSSGASLRAIAREAGVNPALVHYHFGSREGLFEAVVLRALAPIQTRRSASIEALRSKGTRASAAELARLFVEPLLATPADDPRRHASDLRLLGRVFAEQPALTQDLTLKHFGDVMIAFGDLLGEALPELPSQTKLRRMRLCVQAALETLAGSARDEAADETRAARLDDPAVADLIDFLAGGLLAPVARAAPSPR